MIITPYPQLNLASDMYSTIERLLMLNIRVWSKMAGARTSLRLTRRKGGGATAENKLRNRSTTVRLPELSLIQIVYQNAELSSNSANDCGRREASWDMEWGR